MNLQQMNSRHRWTTEAFCVMNLARSRLLRDTTVTSYCKSWILFAWFGLENDEMLARMKSGYRPWRDLHNNPQYSINFLLDGEPIRSPDVEDEREWVGMFDLWWTVTLRNSNFSVVKTLSMGLGIITEGVQFDFSLSMSLGGFLEFITDHAVLEGLQHLGYNSLYSYTDNENNIINCVLFGPLSLVNCDGKSYLGLCNFADDTGKELKWLMSYECGFEDFEETVLFAGEDGQVMEEEIEGYEFTCTHTYTRMEDDMDEEDFPATQEYKVRDGLNRSRKIKTKVFGRVMFRHRLTNGVSRWEHEQEVFINYGYAL